MLYRKELLFQDEPPGVIPGGFTPPPPQTLRQRKSTTILSFIGQNLLLEMGMCTIASDLFRAVSSWRVIQESMWL